MRRTAASVVLLAFTLRLFSSRAVAEELPPPLLTVTFIDVGQGDSALIESGGKAALIDGGPKKAAGAVLSLLSSRSVKKLDLVIATHPDADHIGGLPSILEAVPTDLFIDPGKGHTTSLYLELLDLLKKKSIVYEPGRAGNSYDLGRATVEILNPTNRLPENANDCSVVARVAAGEISVLFAGDAEGKAEEEMIQRGCRLKSTILKAGHHGSGGSTSYVFLARVRPEAVIISSAEKNAFGHPDPETMRLIGVFHAAAYRTDRSGSIALETDGKNYSLSTEAELKDWRRRRQAGGGRERININEATLDELETIPFLSGAKAEAIVQYREMVRHFNSVEELSALPGVGRYIVERIRDFITVGGAQSPAPVAATP
jgi:competence ComEA-like helix-hairpin-helix protein